MPRKAIARIYEVLLVLMLSAMLLGVLGMTFLHKTVESLDKPIDQYSGQVREAIATVFMSGNIDRDLYDLNNSCMPRTYASLSELLTNIDPYIKVNITIYNIDSDFTQTCAVGYPKSRYTESIQENYFIPVYSQETGDFVKYMVSITVGWVK